MFNILDLTSGNIVAIEAEGQISKKDYEKLNPLLEKTVNDFGSINLLIRIKELEGITLPALFSDFRTYIEYRKDFNKVAVVGEKKFQTSLVNITDSFMRADVKYFSIDEYTLAEDWIKE